MYFREIEVGSYFFFLNSTIPFYKTGDTTFVEGGSAINSHASPTERVVHLGITYNQDGTPVEIIIGNYHVPIPLAPVETESNAIP